MTGVVSEAEVPKRVFVGGGWGIIKVGVLDKVAGRTLKFDWGATKGVFTCGEGVRGPRAVGSDRTGVEIDTDIGVDCVNAGDCCCVAGDGTEVAVKAEEVAEESVRLGEGTVKAKEAAGSM